MPTVGIDIETVKLQLEDYKVCMIHSKYHCYRLLLLLLLLFLLLLFPSLPLSSPLFHPSKEFELEITELKKHIAQCQLKGKQLKDSCHYDDHTWVDARLDELNMG